MNIKMGVDKMDQEIEVHGLSNIRVVDEKLNE